MSESQSASDVFGVNLSDNQLNSLIAFIADSFERNEQGSIMTLKRGIYGNSQFYAGLGHYSLFNTCNNWTAMGLKSAGMDISVTLKMTSGSIMDYLKANQTEYRQSTPVPEICVTQ